jgi:hypothetical protein
MAEYSRLAKGHFTSTGAAQIINLPFQPDRVELINYSQVVAGVTNSTTVQAKWDVSMGQGIALVEVYSSGGALIWDNVATNGISTFAAGQLLQYGPLQLLGTTNSAGIALTSGTVLTVTTGSANTILPGDWIVFQNLYQTATTGMQQIAGIPFQVQSTNWSTTSFQVAWLGTASQLTAITTAATSSVAGTLGFKKILYPTLYEPGVCYPYTITVTAGVGTVTCTAPHNFQVGQEIAFRIPSVYGAQNLNSLPNIPIPGSPQYFYVSSVTSATQFTFANAPVLSSAFVVNAAFAAFPGLKFAQCLAVGDVNTGGTAYSGGNLYPSPLLYTNLTQASTINGPAISGAFVNNTSQGFIIGAGAARVTTGAVLVGASGNVIYWTAFQDDLVVN